MFYFIKSISKSLYIIFLILLPLTRAVANELPQQVNVLQTRLKEVNEKIATLSLDQQKAASTIDALQAGLKIADHEFRDLKSMYNQLAINAGIHRTANGHGR